VIFDKARLENCDQRTTWSLIHKVSTDFLDFFSVENHQLLISVAIIDTSTSNSSRAILAATQARAGA
jgi:hypothetical protein